MSTIKIQETLPKPQKEKIQAAIVSLNAGLEKVSHIENEGIQNTIFDLKTLFALMNYDVKIELTQKEFDSFTADNGIDFPKYI